MLKKLFITIFLITCAQTFRLSANLYENDELDAYKHGLIRIVERKIDKAKDELDDLDDGADREDKKYLMLHFYYLGRIHALQEIRHVVLSKD